jgi:hypothetical protein
VVNTSILWGGSVLTVTRQPCPRTVKPQPQGLRNLNGNAGSRPPAATHARNATAAAARSAAAGGTSRYEAATAARSAAARGTSGYDAATAARSATAGRASGNAATAAGVARTAARVVGVVGGGKLGGRCGDVRGARRSGIGRSRWCCSDRCSNSPGHNQRCHEVEFRCHVFRVPHLPAFKHGSASKPDGPRGVIEGLPVFDLAAA